MAARSRGFEDKGTSRGPGTGERRSGAGEPAGQGAGYPEILQKVWNGNACCLHALHYLFCLLLLHDLSRCSVMNEMKPYFFWMILSWSNHLYQAVDVSAKNSIVWGPGLDARITLPARYFFVQGVDRGKNK